MSLPYEVDFDDARKLKFLEQETATNWLDLYLNPENLCSHFDQNLNVPTPFELIEQFAERFALEKSEATSNAIDIEPEDRERHLKKANKFVNLALLTFTQLRWNVKDVCEKLQPSTIDTILEQFARKVGASFAVDLKAENGIAPDVLISLNASSETIQKHYTPAQIFVLWFYARICLYLSMNQSLLQVRFRPQAPSQNTHLTFETNKAALDKLCAQMPVSLAFLEKIVNVSVQFRVPTKGVFMTDECKLKLSDENSLIITEKLFHMQTHFDTMIMNMHLGNIKAAQQNLHYLKNCQNDIILIQTNNENILSIDIKVFNAVKNLFDVVGQHSAPSTSDAKDETIKSIDALKRMPDAKKVEATTLIAAKSAKFSLILPAVNVQQLFATSLNLAKSFHNAKPERKCKLLPVLAINVCRRLSLDRLSTSEFIQLGKRSKDQAGVELTTIVEREMKNHSKLRIFTPSASIEQLAKDFSSMSYSTPPQVQLAFETAPHNIRLLFTGSKVPVRLEKSATLIETEKDILRLNAISMQQLQPVLQVLVARMRQFAAIGNTASESYAQALASIVANEEQISMRIQLLMVTEFLNSQLTMQQRRPCSVVLQQTVNEIFDLLKTYAVAGSSTHEDATQPGPISDEIIVRIGAYLLTDQKSVEKALQQFFDTNINTRVMRLVMLLCIYSMTTEPNQQIEAMKSIDDYLKATYEDVTITIDKTDYQQPAKRRRPEAQDKPNIDKRAPPDSKCKITRGHLTHMLSLMNNTSLLTLLATHAAMLRARIDAKIPPPHLSPLCADAVQKASYSLDAALASVDYIGAVLLTSTKRMLSINANNALGHRMLADYYYSMQQYPLAIGHYVRHICVTSNMFTDFVALYQHSEYSETLFPYMVDCTARLHKPMETVLLYQMMPGLVNQESKYPPSRGSPEFQKLYCLIKILDDCYLSTSCERSQDDEFAILESCGIYHLGVMETLANYHNQKNPCSQRLKLLIDSIVTARDLNVNNQPMTRKMAIGKRQKLLFEYLSRIYC